MQEEDPFSKALSDRDSLQWVGRALTDKSYKKYSNQNVPDNSMTNADLATYGDALLKFVLCGILLGRSEQMSVDKSKYEQDRTLVTVIGKHYRIMDYLKYDRDNNKIAVDYNWAPGSGKKDRSHKHIATAVEAVLGAIYKQHGDMDEIVDIVERWISMVDEENRITDAVRQRRCRGRRRADSPFPSCRRSCLSLSNPSSGGPSSPWS